MNKYEKPYEFPQECPPRDVKIDKGVIVDVVEHEVAPRKTEENASSHSIWEYRGKNPKAPIQ